MIGVEISHYQGWQRADFILIGGNPLEDFTNFRDTLGVMIAGHWYSRETLDEMIRLEK